MAGGEGVHWLGLNAQLQRASKDGRTWGELVIDTRLRLLYSFLLLHQGVFVKYIQGETGCRVQIKGLGSAFKDPNTGMESQEPMHIHLT